MGYHGRRVIYSSATEISEGNIVEEFTKALNMHEFNRAEIDYLYKYYRGATPIENRVKERNADICNRVSEAHAAEIVDFKVGYLMGEPVQYVSRDGSCSEEISKLNEMMFGEEKASQDRDLVEWSMICGTSYRLILPDDVLDEESPFEIYTLDPRKTFVVYENRIGNKPLFAATYTVDEFRIVTASVYTKTHFWELTDGIITRSEPHFLGDIPIIEYPANNSRMGAFELVLPLLDGLDELASSRVDGVDSFVQYFVKFVNCDITSEDFDELKRKGAIKVFSHDGMNADVDIVANELNQDQTQTLVKHMYQTILTICGMPDRSGNGGSGDTGSAVILRDGWQLAEARAKSSELMFVRSEQKFLKIVLRMLANLNIMNLKMSNVDMKFTRRNYENIQSKSQVLTSMLASPKIHPLLAFEHSGMFHDPENAYKISEEYYEANLAAWNPDNPEADEEDGQDTEEVDE